ncbi:hypothetical protein ACIRG5_11615 [Lentzea sp. NPDC102401]|uniref:hypothetical protein n=1 Tax=Lentzea sp. NPDC102401 TaxID=3364128 RepID=UPI00381B8826
MSKKFATHVTAALAALLVGTGTASAAPSDLSPQQVMAEFPAMPCVAGGPTAEDAAQATALNALLTAKMRGSMTAYNTSCARAVVQATIARGLPLRAATIALATTIVETSNANLDGGDRDSIGLFQQRPSMGWGTREQCLDPVYATNKFLDYMVTNVPNWQTRPVGDVAQAVQRSGFPERYQPQANDAAIIAEALVRTNESASVVVEANGAMQVFNRDRNTGLLATNWQQGPGQNWAGWHTPLNVPMVGTPSALLDHQGQMITFSRRGDGHLVQMAQDGPDGEIKTWWDLGGDFAGDPVAVKQPNGNKVVFLRGTDGQLWHKWQNTPDGEFQPSALVHPDLGVVTGRPSVLVDENNLFTVFTVRADGHLIMAAQPSKTAAWVQWDLGGDFTGDPAAVRTADGKFVVFVRGTDGKLWVKWQNEKGGVFPASALVNPGFGQITGAPSAVINPDGFVQVFARRADGHLASAWQSSTSGGVYQGFDDIGGNLTSDPAVGMTSGGAKAVFARSTDGSIITTWQPKPGDPFNRTWSYLLSN